MRGYRKEEAGKGKVRPSLVQVTGSRPEPGGVTPESVFARIRNKEVSGDSPMKQASVGWGRKSSPVTCTNVPPAPGPRLGATSSEKAPTSSTHSSIF